MGAVSQVHADGSIEEWDGDADTYVLRRHGEVLSARPLTAAEAAWLTSGHPPMDPTTLETLRQQARRAYQLNRAFLDLPAPSYPLSQAAQRALVQQVVSLTRQMNGAIRLLLAREMLGVPDDVVTWTCPTGTPLSEDGQVFKFNLAAAPFSPWVAGAPLNVYRVVGFRRGTGTYTARIDVHSGGAVYAAPIVLGEHQTGTETDLDVDEQTWNFDASAIPAGTVLDDVRLAVYLTGDLRVQWQSLCVDSTVPL